jgi:titin
MQITVDVGVTALEIKEVFAEDSGSYAVVAKNLGGEARTSCRVSLSEATLTESMAARVSARRPVRPQFVQPLEDLIVQEGNRVKLECVISGYPEPEVIVAELVIPRCKHII